MFETRRELYKARGMSLNESTLEETLHYSSLCPHRAEILTHGADIQIISPQYLFNC